MAATALETLVPQLRALLRQPPQEVDAQQALLAQTRTALSQLAATAATPPPTQWLHGLEAGACALLLLGDAAPRESDELQRVLCRIGGYAASGGHHLQALWDALIGRVLPLVRADSTAAAAAALARVLDVFLRSAAAMASSAELAFVAREGTALLAHVARQTQQAGAATAAVVEKLLDAAIAAATAASSSAPGDSLAWGAGGAHLALLVLVLRALGASDAVPLAAQRGETVLQQLRSRVAAHLEQRHPFPTASDPCSAVALALSLDAVRGRNSTTDDATWTSVLVRQFALLRTMNLPLRSFDGGAREPTAQSASVSAQALLHDLAHVTRSRFDPAMASLAFRMLDACAIETTTFFCTATAPSAYPALLRALGSAYAPNLLNGEVLREFTACDSITSHDVETNKPSADSAASDEETAAVLGYLRALYTTESSLLRVLVERHPADRSDANPDAPLEAFLTLSRLEFARESCASAEVNAFMSALTQQVEDAVEREYERQQSPRLPPHSSSRAALGEGSEGPSGRRVPRELDVIFGAQALAVGVLVQRKLRVVLFSQPQQLQQPALVDEALALVFSGLYSCYEPLDAFAHNFLGFCLTNLGQYISVYSVAPYYLQRALATYPRVRGTGAADGAGGDSGMKRSLPKSIGVIFGALYYAAGSSAGAGSGSQPSNNSAGLWASLTAWATGSVATVLTPQQRMVLWAMKQCCNRVAELVLGVGAGDIQSVAGADAAALGLQSGVFLASIVFEVLKMGPLELLAPSAMEVELLLSRCAEAAESGDSAGAGSETVASAALRALKTQLFASVSQNCESEKRAWLAAWFVELDALYSTTPVSSLKSGIEEAAVVSEGGGDPPHSRL
ncbi:hypothetical protein PybrP1_007392 [[Pythium] brassicae (nom. inval.)]|nr:hypothetical protein PybrP1_007392 [[Pythium] brassicae (nom. inval.)]